MKTTQQYQHYQQYPIYRVKTQEKGLLSSFIILLMLLMLLIMFVELSVELIFSQSLLPQILWK